MIGTVKRKHCLSKNSILITPTLLVWVGVFVRTQGGIKRMKLEDYLEDNVEDLIREQCEGSQRSS